MREGGFTVPARRNTWLWVTFGVLALIVVVLFSLTGFYTDFLWFQSLGFSAVFIKTFVYKLRLGALIFLSVGTILAVNFAVVRARLWPPPGMHLESDDSGNLLSMLLGPLAEAFSPRRLKLLFILGGYALAGLIGINLSTQWLVFERFLTRTPFGVIDPIFNKDVSYYVFSIPALEFGYDLLMSALTLALLGTALLYLMNRAVGVVDGSLEVTPPAKAHLSILIGLLLVVKAAGYRLAMYKLLYSPVGVVFGAGYADIHAHVPAYKFLTILAAVLGLLLIVNGRLRRLNLVFVSIVVLMASSFLLGTIYPYFVQQFTVTPNEIARETPYIENGIKFTRLAHDLTNVKESDFPVKADLTAADINKNQATIKNVRLWDYRPLKDTYSQLQEIRLYYAFQDVDIDRYKVGGIYRQVMISPREINVNALTASAQTWQNLHLKYTHGYGVVMSPTTEFTTEGLPHLWVKDIPPVSVVPDIKVTRPEIYHGEMTDQYVIVKTKTAEFDYPVGDSNATVFYQGTGGVPISNALEKLAFAIRLESYQMLLTDAITTGSRVMFYRNIAQRVQKLAPFLELDPDPYIVVGDDGRLFWIQDAYTTTNRYPYSQPLYGKLDLNYIRNAAKVVIDAYNGDVTFYLFDTTDPLVKSYQKIFPNLFRPYTEMRPDLKKHVRYPSLMFEVQAYMYQTYHMTNPVVFYNKEDVWDIPKQTTSNPAAAPTTNAVSQQASASPLVEPQYIITKLPGETEEEYIQMMPFTPVNKNNMIGWMAARSDGDRYGQLVVFKFPKQQLVYGPRQIDARIDQDPSIAQSLTLWGQKDARTIRGQIMVLPMGNSILYVEPLYLQATGNKFPELKRVIVAYGDQVVMDESLDRALERIFGTGISTGPGTGPSPGQPGRPGTGTGTVPTDLVTRARDLFNQAQGQSQQGDWAGYGQTLKELGRVLDELAGKSQNQ